VSDFVIRPGRDDEIDACVELWEAACAERDGARIAGVGARARAKFPNRLVWFVAERDGVLGGFTLGTRPGSGVPSDPSDAAVVGMLAVAPHAQGSGLGRRLLRAAAGGLAGLDYERAVLHVLVDNAPAVRLYESEGWQPIGETFEHALQPRACQTYALALAS
jgi:ribosomal protein S18 acetylase RimI-like enzyme